MKAIVIVYSGQEPSQYVLESILGTLVTSGTTDASTTGKITVFNDNELAQLAAIKAVKDAVSFKEMTAVNDAVKLMKSVVADARNNPVQFAILLTSVFANKSKKENKAIIEACSLILNHSLSQGVSDNIPSDLLSVISQIYNQFK